MLGESALVICLGLFLLTFVHEETGIIAAGYLVTEDRLGVAVVLPVLTLGIIAGDWIIFAIGAVARRLPWFERWLASEKLMRSRDWLQRRMLLVIVVARLFPGPGILFPVFSGLGFLRAGFPRFALWSSLVAAIYTPGMLYLTVLYGDALVPHVGWIAWVALLVVPAIGIFGPWARPLRRWASRLVGLELTEKKAGKSEGPGG